MRSERALATAVRDRARLLQPLDVCAGAANDDGDGRERDLAPLLTHVERRRKSLLHALDGRGQTEERERPADAVEVKHRVVRLLPQE